MVRTSMALTSTVRAYVTAFLLGAVVMGGFDYLYTQTGGQYYYPKWILAPFAAWPWYVPFQMGLVSLLMLHLWGWMVTQALRWLGWTVPATDSRNYIAPLMFLVASLGLCFVFLGSPWHSSVFVVYLTLSYGTLILWGTRLDLLAFCAIGLAGALAEWFLLAPGVNYWQFQHQDLFDRLPAWEPCVYGWVGVLVHRLVLRTRHFDYDPGNIA